MRFPVGLLGRPPLQGVRGAVVMPLPASHRDRFPINDLVCLDEDEIRPVGDVFDLVDDVLVVACRGVRHADRRSAPDASDI